MPMRVKRQSQQFSPLSTLPSTPTNPFSFTPPTQAGTSEDSNPDAHHSARDEKDHTVRSAACRSQRKRKTITYLPNPVVEAGREKRRKEKRQARADRASFETMESVIAAELGNADVVHAMREALSHPSSIQSPITLTILPIHSFKSTPHLISFFVRPTCKLVDDGATQWSRVVMYRIQAACFYRLYEISKADVDRSSTGDVPSVFLQHSAALLSHEQNKSPTQLPPRCKAATAVRDHLTDLIFLLDGRLDTPEGCKRTRRAIETQQQLGKRRAQIFGQLGYEAVVLLPSSLTSYRMTITKPQLSQLIRLLEKRVAELESTLRAEAQRAVQEIFMPQVDSYKQLMTTPTALMKVLSPSTVT